MHKKGELRSALCAVNSPVAGEGVPNALRSRVSSQVSVLTGGGDKPYAFGLCAELVSKGLHVDVIGSDDLDAPEMHSSPLLTFLNLQRGWQPTANVIAKIWAVVSFYVRLMHYAAMTKARIFHILWNHHNKVEYFDRTVMMCFYKILGKKVALTVHNVNTKKRDGADSIANRVTLKMQYRLADHMFVHTGQMAAELCSEFDVPPEKVTVIPFGINNISPRTALTSEEAKAALQLSSADRVILFFGRIQPYKGLEYVIEALDQLSCHRHRYVLIIAGEPMQEYGEYWKRINERIGNKSTVLKRIERVPDDEVEMLFKAADVTVLAYTDIYQSGVIVLAYSFGLPAIASRVGSFPELIVEGETGFLCKVRDSEDLALTIEKYFSSDLYANLECRREAIRQYADAHHSWDVVGKMTCELYSALDKGCVIKRG